MPCCYVALFTFWLNFTSKAYVYRTAKFDLMRRSVLSFSKKKTQKTHTLIPKNDVTEPKVTLLLTNS